MRRYWIWAVVIVHRHYLEKRFTKSEMHMVDVNPRAVQLAKENAIRNKVEVSVCVSELYEAVAIMISVKSSPIRRSVQGSGHLSIF